MLDTQGEDLVVRLVPDKLERLRSFPVPHSPADVQSLIGIIKTFDRWSIGILAKCTKIRELNKQMIHSSGLLTMMKN